MLLLAYLFELSSAKTRIPAVIFLLFIGYLSRRISDLIGLNIPDLNPVLPFFGTIGLILIVLEGALELKINKHKVPVLKKSLLMAVLPMIVLSTIFGTMFWYAEGVTFKTALMNALPFCVISSSIAIPAAKNIHYNEREFVIYESSFSDIIGVLFFNFVLINQSFRASTIGLFILQVLLITLISFFSVYGLSFLLGRIRNHITYTPIILIVILIYAVAKEFDLSGLLFILVFGLFMGNIAEIRKFYLLDKLIERMYSERLGMEILKFRSITVEATFIVRSIFFLLFGFILNTEDFLNIETLPWAVGIVIVTFLVRWLFLKILKLSVQPLFYFSPRGLITILLFLSIIPGEKVSFVNNSLMIQVIILSVFVLLFGLLRKSTKRMDDVETQSV
jgi:hypothetical protein